MFPHRKRHCFWSMPPLYAYLCKVLGRKKQRKEFRVLLGVKMKEMEPNEKTQERKTKKKRRRDAGENGSGNALTNTAPFCPRSPLVEGPGRPASPVSPFSPCGPGSPRSPGWPKPPCSPGGPGMLSPGSPSAPV